MCDFRTDLALERNEIYKQNNNIENDIDGIIVEEEENDNLKKTRITITNENGEKALGKPKGIYTTFDIRKMKFIDDDKKENIKKNISEELKNIINKHIDKNGQILVVGLGNMYVTPDALGPKVVPEIEVTRHLLTYMPEALPEGTREVSAVSPGVLGITGIETMEILKGIVDNVKPKLLIVIDALAARNINRISSSIQISDTGISPGAGVDNKRKEISVDTMGVPVIAMGIPTVVDLATITNDCANIFIRNLPENKVSNEIKTEFEREDKYEQIREALNIDDFNMIVTPKEIDELIENMKDIISKGINYAIN